MFVPASTSIFLISVFLVLLTMASSEQTDDFPPAPVESWLNCAAGDFDSKKSSQTGYVHGYNRWSICISHIFGNCRLVHHHSKTSNYSIW
ncbi:hypothetical protein C5167_018195 [Papaver somniferum]|uniref:Uncharacterized protein n=1 Tax=Papaver somniferum TaxID=3469 RepID=A0A4Y7IQN1_PAPSO|nr:hypothetical protein C5167_018195 [Papaver somniferum]